MSLFRASKLLNYLGTVIVNGPTTPLVTNILPAKIKVVFDSGEHSSKSWQWESGMYIQLALKLSYAFTLLPVIPLNSMLGSILGEESSNPWLSSKPDTDCQVCNLSKVWNSVPLHLLTYPFIPQIPCLGEFFGKKVPNID